MSGAEAFDLHAHSGTPLNCLISGIRNAHVPRVACGSSGVGKLITRYRDVWPPVWCSHSPVPISLTSASALQPERVQTSRKMEEVR
jgi:hypothetical protein